MPSPEGLEILGQRLLDDRARLIRLLEMVESDTSALEEELPVERLDQAQGEEGRALLAGLEEQERTELQEIDHALGCMASGSYGLCGECGRGIFRARLYANPSVNVCLRCQEVREFHRAGTGSQERVRFAL